MSTNCPKCNELILEDEPFCWQCGTQLQETNQPETKEKQAESANNELLVYSMIFLTLIGLSCFFLQQLNKQPLVEINAIELSEGGDPITPLDRSFTFLLDPSWTVLDADATADWQEKNEIWPKTNQLFATSAPDGMIQLIAEKEEIGAFLIVWESSLGLNWNYAATVAETKKGNLIVDREDEIIDFAKTHYHFFTQFDIDGNNWQCQQIFSNTYTDPRQNSSMLVSICSPERYYSRLTDEMLITLNSFQQLFP